MDWKSKFPIGQRVQSPLGRGKVIGYVFRIVWGIIVSLDSMPLDTFDHGGVVVSVHCFRPGKLELIEEVSNEE
jgi:hypothetical protein